MIKTINIFLFSFLISLNISGQTNIDFKNANFKNNKDGLKLAEQNIDNGDKILEQIEEIIIKKLDVKDLYLKAFDSYKKANDFNPNNAELNLKIGKCLLETYRKSEALPYLEKSLKLMPGEYIEVYFLLGQGYSMELDFNKAKENFNLYKTKAKEKDFEKNKANFNKAFNACELIQQSIANPAKVWIDNLDEVNTQYDDFNANITTDEEMMYFNSNRPSGAGGSDNSHVYYSTNKNGFWAKPELLKGSINTLENDECLAVSPDGQKMFVLKNDPDANIYISELNGDTWEPPRKLGEGKISSSFNETAASFSGDGIKVYFVCDDPYGNRGGKDIFFSGKMHPTREQWGIKQTIGSEINTPEDDIFIFMHPDGQSMYFASKGHGSMGGYDIFKSKRLSGVWSKPINMGYPINTPYDEVAFTLSANGKHGYVTSNRKTDSKGGFDIYKVTFIGSPKPQIVETEDQLLSGIAQPIKDNKIESAVDVDSKNLTVFKGIVLDAFSKKPLEAELEITDNSKNELISTFKTNSKTGKFLLSLPSGINYGIAVKAPDYMFYSENIDFPATSDFQLIEREILLTNVCIGCKIILRNIFFDFGKANLRPESTTELTRLIDLINAIAKIKPNVKIEISGHTDNIGSNDANQLLSENRAKSVVNYLIQKGISSSKLIFKGYGSAQAVADNKNEIGRQLNRRTEFKIIE